MTQIKKKKEGNLVTRGPRGGESAIFKKDGSWGLLKTFRDGFKGPLGTKAEDLLAEENEEIGRLRKDTEESQKELKKAEQAALNKQRAEEILKKARERLSRLEARRKHLQEGEGSPLKIKAK